MNSAPATKDTVRKAYEFALNHIGHDKESGSIWSDYIQFLKDLEVRYCFCGAHIYADFAKATTAWEEGQKNDAIRKAYQRVVQIPTDNVKRLWEEWQDWENGLNKITVRSLLV